MKYEIEPKKKIVGYLFTINTWSKHVWRKNIPLSKSIIAWKLIHNELAIDDKLKLKRCNHSSVFSFCLRHEETYYNIFLGIASMLPSFGIGMVISWVHNIEYPPSWICEKFVTLIYPLKACLSKILLSLALW